MKDRLFDHTATVVLLLLYASPWAAIAYFLGWEGSWGLIFSLSVTAVVAGTIDWAMDRRELDI